MRKNLPPASPSLPQSHRNTHDQSDWRHPNTVCFCQDIKRLNDREILIFKVLKFGTR